MRTITDELNNRATFNCVLCDIILHDFTSLDTHLNEYHKVKPDKPLVFDIERNSGCVAIVIDNQFYDEWFAYRQGEKIDTRWEKHFS